MACARDPVLRPPSSVLPPPSSVLRYDPRDPATYTNFGVLELTHGHAPEAANLFAEALSIDPALPDAQQGLAEARRALGQQ